MKAEILQLLRERGDFVSGQELCERFQVSRTAVWKSIQQLQKEGYQIEAVTRRGYRLDGFPDTVAAAEVESRLHTQWIGRPVRYFEEIASTNQYAKQMAEDGAPEGLLVVADCQTKGAEAASGEDLHGHAGDGHGSGGSLPQVLRSAGTDQVAQ